VSAPLGVQSRPFRAGELDVVRLGRAPFDAVGALREHLVERRLARAVCDTLILCEHDALVTIGRGLRTAEIAQLSIPVVEVEPGAEAAFHGPGQLVALPILELCEARRSSARFRHDLEELVIRALAELEVIGQRKPGATGVWVSDRRVCSIEHAAARGISWGRLALNLHADLAALEPFRALGLDLAHMANVEESSELPAHSLLLEVLLVKHVCEVFELELPPIPPPPAPGPLAIFPGPH
jgi:lipoyl(octanoyl) transferase